MADILINIVLHLVIKLLQVPNLANENEQPISAYPKKAN
jgi:hypothetical protein